MMLLRYKRWLATGMAAAIFGTGLLVPPLAQAGETGRRNTAYGLGALTLYLFSRGGDKFPAFLSGLGTAYAIKRYDDAVKARHKRQRYLRSRYSRNRYNRYSRQYRHRHRAGYPVCLRTHSVRYARK